MVGLCRTSSFRPLRGEEITIYGDGHQTRCFCYVTDLIDGLCRLMDTGDEVTGPINLGNPVEISMTQLAETILKLTGSRSKLTYRSLPPDDPTQRRPIIERAKDTLGWEPQVDLEAGLKATIAYFDSLL